MTPLSKFSFVYHTLRTWKRAAFLLICTQMALIVAIYLKGIVQQIDYHQPTYANRVTPVTMITTDAMVTTTTEVTRSAPNLEPTVTYDPSHNVTTSTDTSDLGFTFTEVRRDTSCRSSKCRRSNTSIAIGLGVSTRQMLNLSQTQLIIQNMPFFNSLLTSFCRTATRGFNYHFFVAYDHDDPYLQHAAFQEFLMRHFRRVTSRRCPKESPYTLHLVQCTHSGRPAWAQNDAMLAAYLHGMDYFYRVNDDTLMVTKGWAPIFIRELEAFSPPRVGVVGPNHVGGRVKILTYDFVHRTHVDIFGFYYPRCYTDWYADGWISGVYAPTRVTKVTNVTLKHTMGRGTRYQVHKMRPVRRDIRIKRDKETLNRYVRSREAHVMPSRTKVIALSLHDDASAATWGAIRNANLASVVFPEWTVRVYIPPSAATSNIVSYNMLKSLRNSAVELEVMNATLLQTIPSNLYYWMVADDGDVDYFLLRRVTSRFTERDAAAVASWMRSNMTVHGLRDDPSILPGGIAEGLWGAERRQFRVLMGASMADLLRNNSRTHNMSTQTRRQTLAPSDFLNRHIVPKVTEHMLYHDSIACKDQHSTPYPVTRKGLEYVGMNYSAYEEPIIARSYASRGAPNSKCKGQGQVVVRKKKRKRRKRRKVKKIAT